MVVEKGKGELILVRPSGPDFRLSFDGEGYVDIDDCNIFEDTTLEGLPINHKIWTTPALPRLKSEFFHSVYIEKIDDHIDYLFLCVEDELEKCWGQLHWNHNIFFKTLYEQLEYLNHSHIYSIKIDHSYDGLVIRAKFPEDAFVLDSIQTVQGDIHILAKEAKKALFGIRWDDQYHHDEKAFSQEILLPLIRRMGFSSVRYRHGTKEYGKDITFAEATPFGDTRYNGLQAKAGSISGEAGSKIGIIIEQIKDAFSMPFLEMGSKNPIYISTFILAISGHFTENAREKIAQIIPEGLIGSVYFIDQERISELQEKYWRY